MKSLFVFGRLRIRVNSLSREELIARLSEAEEVLSAIRSGSVDAVVVSGPEGERTYTLRGADHTYRLLVENMDQGAVVMSIDGTLLYCNRRLASLTKASGDALVGTQAAELVTSEHRQGFGAIFRKALEGQNARAEMRLETSAGVGPQVFVSMADLELENAKTVYMLVTDLTEQKRTEELLRAYSERLDAKNKDLRFRAADQLSKLSSELAMAEQRERKRIAALLHDGLQQYLASAKMQLGWVSEGSKINEIFETTRQVENVLAEAIDIARSLSIEMSPPALREDSLSAGLSWLARWMLEKHDLHVDLQVDTEVRMREDIKFLAFESVRELLFNK